MHYQATKRHERTLKAKWQKPIEKTAYCRIQLHAILEKAKPTEAGKRSVVAGVRGGGTGDFQDSGPILYDTVMRDPSSRIVQPHRTHNTQGEP